uniref:Uncharacterized protein n=1 Tax=Fagus sylvatica TaxID=28930 RepID=A0A2N9F3Y4_FAGSY
MESEGGSWTSVRSEDLPEGLSDRDEGTRSLEETPSISGSSEGAGPEAKWTARFYLSKGVRFPLQPLMRELLNHLNLSPGQLAPQCLEDGRREYGHVEREWKDDYVFVCGDNWEGLVSEKDDELYPSPSKVGRAFVLCAQTTEARTRTAITGYFGHCTTTSTITRMATAKLNREKLKKMMMSQQEEAPLKPSLPEPVPTSSVEVVEISAEPSSSRSLEKVPTLPRDASLACRRAKSVITKDDVGEYDKVNTDVIKVAGIHSLMKGLTELTVIANRCTQWEEALLKQKIQMSEAAQANQRRDEELKKALDGARRSDEQVKTLASQLEGARVSAVEEFKSSEAYDDVNTKYFLSGFNLLKKQAKEKFPELDFDGFQPFDDDESTMPADEENVEKLASDPQMDDDATS